MGKTKAKKKKDKKKKAAKLTKLQRAAKKKTDAKKKAKLKEVMAASKQAGLDAEVKAQEKISDAMSTGLLEAQEERDNQTKDEADALAFAEDERLAEAESEAAKEEPKGPGRPQGQGNLPVVKRPLPGCPNKKCNSPHTEKIPGEGRNFPLRHVKIDNVMYKGFNLSRWKCKKCNRHFIVRTPFEWGKV